jgi:hypothetical protein
MIEIDPARVWSGVVVRDTLVICPSCSAVVLWRDKASHRKFHADLVTALTNQPELVDDPPPF